MNHEVIMRNISNKPEYYNRLQEKIPLNEYRIRRRAEMENEFGDCYSRRGDYDVVLHILISREYAEDESIEGRKVDGVIYDDIVLRDDRNRNTGEVHFNMNHTRYFKGKEDAEYYCLTYPNSHSGHFVRVSDGCTTSEASMVNVYKLPNVNGEIKDKGSLKELLESGFKYEDYD